jgi:thiol:disulfide interchange protein
MPNTCLTANDAQPMQHLKHCLLVFGLVTAAAAPAAEWRHGTEQSTVAAAAEQAKREGKVVMFNFTGSDWCSWCMKLKQEVFSRPNSSHCARPSRPGGVDFQAHRATGSVEGGQSEAAKGWA